MPAAAKFTLMKCNFFPPTIDHFFFFFFFFLAKTISDGVRKSDRVGAHPRWGTAGRFSGRVFQRRSSAVLFPTTIKTANVMSFLSPDLLNNIRWLKGEHKHPALSF